MSGRSGTSSLLVSLISTYFIIYVICWFVVIDVSLTRAQNIKGTQPTTAPSEVRALNSIFEQWKIKANFEWNISGEPCSGAAINNSIYIDNSPRPFIKCDCTFNNGSLCHITQLKVSAMDFGGQIPEELWTLTYLSYLHLGNNFLTGSLSPSIGNLTNLQVLSLGANALSGQVPKELGLLTQLSTLYILSNNFSGPLPPELGNLTKLEIFSFTSCGVSGEIPSTFENLRSIKSL
ncbi:hypothetical protein CsatA_002537 [Cannabis sativa]